jgi:oxygen-dependent protoporphyrinogen oxidase
MRVVKRLVVVGGGIAGLAAAHAAAERRGGAPAGVARAEIEIVLVERCDRLGGKALTAREGEWTVEAGPNGYLAPDPAIERLVRAAGLDHETQPADAAAAHRFVVRGGRMREVSAHPLRFATAGVLGPLGLLRLLGEPLIGRRETGADESVWDFARRRLGRQAADRLVAPMVLGTFAGDARRLSAEAAFPRLVQLERAHGSLLRGMVAGRRAAVGGGGGAPALGGRLTSFRGGMETLPAALGRAIERGGVRVRSRAPVRSIERDAAGTFHVRLERETIEAAAVVIACEAWAGAELVAETAPELARRLGELVYPPVAVVALGFAAADARRIPHGFGVLVPRGEGARALGLLWESFIFPDRSPQGAVLVRAMFGGAVDPEAAAADDAALERWARDDLRRLAGVEGAPIFRRVLRWERAIPQYELGHAERVRGIEAEVARVPGLYLAGNALHGIAFGKAAASGLATGEAAAEWLMLSE